MKKKLYAIAFVTMVFTLFALHMCSQEGKKDAVQRVEQIQKDKWIELAPTATPMSMTPMATVEPMTPDDLSCVEKVEG